MHTNGTSLVAAIRSALRLRARSGRDRGRLLPQLDVLERTGAVDDVHLVGRRRWDDLGRSQQLAAFQPRAQCPGARRADSLF